MATFEKEVTNIRALFPQVNIEDIIEYMIRIPEKAGHLRIPLTLKYFFMKEEIQHVHILRDENLKHAQLIHELFPIYGVHKIMKKLTKYGNIPDRCRLVIKNILKSKEEELSLVSLGRSEGLEDEHTNQDVYSDHELCVGNGTSNHQSLDKQGEKEQFDLIDFLVEKTAEPRENIGNHCVEQGYDTLCRPPESELNMLIKVFMNERASKRIFNNNITFDKNESRQLDESEETLIESPIQLNEDQIPSCSKDSEPTVVTAENSSDNLNTETKAAENYFANWEDEVPQLSLDETLLSEGCSESIEKDAIVETTVSDFRDNIDSGPSIEIVSSTDIDPETNEDPRISEGEFDEFNFALIEPDPPSVSSSVNIESTEGIPDVTTVSDTPENQETLGALPFISCVESVAESSSYEPVKKKRKKNDKMLQLSRNDHFDLIEYVAEITSKSRREVATYCLENGIDVYKKPPEMQLTAMINHFIYGEGQDSADEFFSFLGQTEEMKLVSSSDESSDTPLALTVENKNGTIAKSGNNNSANGNAKPGISKQQYNQIMSRLMEIFPEADPAYIRKLYDETPMQANNDSAVIDILIEKMLTINNYPRRPKREPTPEEVDIEEQIAFIQELLPDADPDFLRMKVQELTAEQLKSFVTEALENKTYPTIKEALRNQQLSAQMRQYTTEFTVENFVKIVPDPLATFEDPKRNIVLDKEDLYYIVLFFKNKFNKIYAKTIQYELMKYNHQPYKSFKALKGMPAALKNARVKVPLPSFVCKKIPLLQELAFIEHEAEIIKYVTQLKEQELEERLQAKNAGLMLTCNCCYDDEIMPKDSHTCNNNCVFCKQCIIKSTEVAFGEGKLDFPCLGDCGSTFSLETLKVVLPPNLFSKIAQKKAVAEVKAAGIENLEFCPFCDFATIPHGPPETYKIFTCQNPDCLKETCRLCKEASHVPLRCDEVEKDADVKNRVYIENKMTEALLRKCWKCGISFYKEEGCNKMTCSCGAHMCYLCGKPVTDYKHFNGIGGDRFDLCPLYSDTLAINQQNVLKGAQAAKEEIGIAGTSGLKIDPTADVEKHFKDRAKKLPREPHIDLLGRMQHNEENRQQIVRQGVREIMDGLARLNRARNNQNHGPIFPLLPPQAHVHQHHVHRGQAHHPPQVVNNLPPVLPPVVELPLHPIPHPHYHHAEQRHGHRYTPRTDGHVVHLIGQLHRPRRCNGRCRHDHH